MNKPSESVTGRDGYIIAKALKWALIHAETLPDHEREWSDEDDMRQLLDERYSLQSALIGREGGENA